MAVDAASATRELSSPGGDLDEVQTAADESVPTDAHDVADYDEAVGETDVGDAAADGIQPARHLPTPLVLAFVAGMVSVVALGALTGWLGYRAHRSQQVKAERELYLRIADGAAVDITSIDYRHADADIKRILDSATGQLHDEFAKGAKPFVDIVTKEKSSSQGTVMAAGLESVAPGEAQAIVAVSVTTSVADKPAGPPRSWRMRLTVQKSGDDFKISSVRFVT
ncbi:Mce protein [Mycobacterium sp. AZCC_0083]|uniref:Mce protein n=1 Tax=Mycobacterium sp. AZCC_0083 TaxID=2735882 RepID=UPI0016173896|nr:Mce protein [Mycobacterium sp. AZCC_0083]MBB5160681.1 Mce-associated membrane protein [Mycobacterium sp. AZCC_0083]